MRNFFKIILCGCAAILFTSACRSDNAEPVKYKAPVVEFTMPSDSISATVGEAVEFSARVVSGDKVSVGWYIDGDIVASSQTFSYVFEKAGEYDVRFEARNGAGSSFHDYHVQVADRLAIHLSVGDSTVVRRVQLEYLLVAAIVDYGSEVTHEWSVDGVVCGDDAFFGSFRLDEARDYAVHYRGSNMLGSFEQDFTVAVSERPLEVSFSIADEIIAMFSGKTLGINANVLYGGTGATHKWYLDNVLVCETASFTHSFTEVGSFALRYECSNAKGETVTRSWTVNVTSSGVVFDDFEADEIGSWFNLRENQPGIELVDNPDKSGINTSAKCLRDRVSGSGSTSGYFTLKASVMLSAASFDVSEYSGIRFLVHLGQNSYYPRIDYNGTKYPSVTKPKFQNQWERLEYKLPDGATFSNTKNIVFRMLYNEAGSNISGGSYDTPTNSRTVYIDDIEFFK